MIHDIITEHRERMLNLKKYYPFFKLIDISFSQFRGGKYEILDMGYIVMGILRFFIEENNFKEKDVTYAEYFAFLKELIHNDFALELSEEEYREVAEFCFDKIRNDGKPFSFVYFDPVERKRRVSRMKIIESEIYNNTVYYSISADAVEFYLDTKEIKDESRISVQQLLLEKMIRARNFKGGTEVVERINDEVARLQIKKNEVMQILSKDIFAGIDAYEEFVDTGMRWFKDEEKLFKKNKDLIQTAFSKMELNDAAGEGYFKTMGEIHELDRQLQLAMSRHAELLKACTDMQKMTDEALQRAKLGRLRSHVDFQSMLKRMIKNDNAEVLEEILAPMFKPHVQKSFPMDMTDDALTVKPKQYSEVEKVSVTKAEDIVFDDVVEEERIKKNYIFLMKNLLSAFEQRNTFLLSEFSEALCRMYSPDILKNADYYSFFVHLCQKMRFTVGKGSSKDGFLDNILEEEFKDKEAVTFILEPVSEMQGEESDEFIQSDIRFTLAD
jgi:hypothetical protein